MFRILIAAVLVYGSAASLRAQDPEIKQVERKNTQGTVVERYRTVDGKYDGEYERFYDDGKLWEKGVCRANKREGAWIFNHSNGHKSFEGTYKGGLFEGAASQYHTSGRKYAEGAFTKGHLSGKVTYWHDSELVDQTGDVSNSGENSFSYITRQGAWTYNHGNGKKSFEGTYKDNLLDGAASHYHPSGRKYAEGTFTKGRLSGKVTYWHDSEHVESTGEASNSSENSFSYITRQRAWVYNHGNGNKSFECGYVDNIFDGPATKYYASGPKAVTATFDRGQLTGEWTAFHENGKLAAVGEAMGSARADSIDHPVRAGLWVEYHDNGNRSFDGTYVNGEPDGFVSLYHRNGEKWVLAAYVEGNVKGGWTSWFENGKTAAHGHAYTTASPGRNAQSVSRHGPWILYHDNGSKESEGRYHLNQKAGPWVYYDRDGKLREVKNHVPEGEKAPISSAELADGSKVYSTVNPDGSTDTLTFDKNGKLTKQEHNLPLDKQKAYVSYTDPDTGETVVITHDADGTPNTTRSTTTTGADGAKRTSEADSDGTTREITDRPDGARSMVESRPDGTRVTTERAKDGTVTRHYDNPDGTSRDYTYRPDGSRMRVRRDADGKVLDTTSRDPVGVEHMKLADGTEVRRHKDGDGNLVETRTTPGGDTTRIARDKAGKEISRDDKWGKRAPGESLYSDMQGGKDWSGLTDEERKSFADREAAMKDKGMLDEARRDAANADLRRAASPDLDADKTAADTDLARKPATDAAKRLDDPENIAAAGTALKVFDWLLSLPETRLRMIQEELSKALEDKDKDKLAELLATDRKGLVSFLNRNPGLLKAWEEKIKPTANAASSLVAMALNVAKGVDCAMKGEYGEAINSFLDAGISGLKLIPPAEMAKLERELRANPSTYMTAIKNMITFGRELNRELKPGESRNYGTLLKEGAEFMLNAYRSLPEAERKHFIERRMPLLRNMFKKLEDGTPGAKVVLGLIESAPEIYKLLDEWNSENRAANITAVAQKVGPKTIGLLVRLSTGSDAAAEAAEFLAQVGTDYLAGLGNEAREAARAALNAAGTEANAYANMRNVMQEAARKSGMSAADARDYEHLANLISGHGGRTVLSDMQRRKDLLGIREATQAWRRVDAHLRGGSGAVGFLYANLQDDTKRRRENEDSYQRWLQTHVGNAARTVRYIDKVINEYPKGGAARRFLLSWRADLQFAVDTLGR